MGGLLGWWVTWFALVTAAAAAAIAVAISTLGLSSSASAAACWASLACLDCVRLAFLPLPSPLL